jgi:hypothetical protein
MAGITANGIAPVVKGAFVLSVVSHIYNFKSLNTNIIKFKPNL